MIVRSRGLRPCLARRFSMEPLERRQLLSMSFDLRLRGGGSGNEVAVTTVGQIVSAQVWVTVTGTNSTGTDEGVQDVSGGFLSSNVNGGAALGDIQATLLAPFNGNGSRTGAQQDLDGDGDLDDGRTTGGRDLIDSFFARSNTLTRTNGELGTNSQAFHIGDITFAVTNLLFGSEASTELRFLPRIGNLTGVWLEDGVAKAVGLPFLPDTGTVVAGTRIVLRRDIGEAQVLQQQVQSLPDPNSGQKNALLSRLDLKDNNGDIGKVQSFILAVQALVKTGRIAQSAADLLLRGADVILASLDRPPR
jgi:hypothetical protein